MKEVAYSLLFVENDSTSVEDIRSSFTIYNQVTIFLLITMVGLSKFRHLKLFLLGNI